MLKFEESLSLQKLPLNVYQDLVKELNKDNCWRTLADCICETLDSSGPWRRDLEENLNSKHISQGEMLLKELTKRMCTIGILSSLLEHCKLEKLLSILQSTVPVIINVHPTDSQVYLGHKLHLKCSASGIPPPNYQWYHENNKLSDQTSNELILQVTLIPQQGSYHCKVSQIDHKGELLHEIFSNSALVTIMPCPVVIEKEPLPFIAVKEGESLILDCDASGYPYPHFQWYRDNTQLVGQVNKTLQIEKFSLEEEGKYYCHVTNKISENFTQKSVVVLDLPRQKAIAKVALLIANENYYSQVQLNTPKNDVVAVANILQGLGFVTICLADLTLTQMNHAIKIFSESLVEGTYGLYYFAGHGFKMQESYMLPIDAPESYLRKDSVCESQLLSLTLKNDPALMVVILDMCQTAPKVEWNPKIHEEIPSINEYIGQKDLRNLLQAYSTSSHRPSYEYIKGEYGLYATHLCKYLGENIPVIKVFEEVGKSIDKYLEGAERNQIPMFATTLTKAFRFTDAFSTDSPPSTVTSIEALMKFPKKMVEVRFDQSGIKCKAKVSQYIKPLLNFVHVSIFELDNKWDIKFYNSVRVEPNNLQNGSVKNTCWIHNPQIPLVLSLEENGVPIGAQLLPLTELIPAILSKLFET